MRAIIHNDGRIEPLQLFYASGAAPTWDATLAVSPVTSRKPIYIQDIDQYLQDIVQPIDYGLPGRGRFARYIDSTFVNPSSLRKDVVYGWMTYNSAATFARADPTEAAAWYKMETFYEQSGNRMEFHMPEIDATDGTNARIMSIYANRDTAQSFINYNTFSFNWISSNDVNTDWAALGTGPVGTVELNLNAQLGTGGILGTADNYCRIVMADGYGTVGIFYQQGLGHWISTGQSIVLSPTSGWLQVPTRLTFDQADYSGVGDVYLEGATTGNVRGFIFYDSGQTTVLAFINHTQMYFPGRDTIIGFGTATGFSVLAASTLPFDYGVFGLQTMWTDGSFWKTYVSADVVQFDLGKSGKNNTVGAVAQTTFTVTHGLNLVTATYGVQITPNNALTATQPFYVTNLTATTFDVVFAAGLTGTVTFYWEVNIL